ncbi:MAG: DUF4834 family protein [Bacteroidales bacterium]|nr:DUF4834 family protein [Bacteroidales bacterium]
MKLLIFIAIFIASYYIISKYLFPYLVSVFIRKTQEKFGDFHQRQAKNEIKKEGEISVKYVPPETNKSKFNPDSTEEVDFEEIKDK